MLDTVLPHLERGSHVEDLLAVLDGDDAARRETVAVATAVDLVHDRCVEIATPQEVGVQ